MLLLMKFEISTDKIVSVIKQDCIFMNFWKWEKNIHSTEVQKSLGQSKRNLMIPSALQ